jgi:hypothetical protein
MKKIKIMDLPKDYKVSKEELMKISGGTLATAAAILPVSSITMNKQESMASLNIDAIDITSKGSGR